MSQTRSRRCLRSLNAFCFSLQLPIDRFPIVTLLVRPTRQFTPLKRHSTPISCLHLPCTAALKGGKKINIKQIWETVAPPNIILSVCAFVYLSDCLSRSYGMYLGYFEFDYDEIWWKCWNLDPYPIDCIRMS